MNTTLEKVFGPEYLKIQTVFKRDERNIIVPGNYSTDEIAFLKDKPWVWTEKVDGTNIRVHWNGENITVGGRTDNAQIPTFLVAALGFLNHPPMWNEIFPDSNDVTVYGEGYGPKIQSGGHYRQDHSLVVLDVRVGDWWLREDDVKDVATKLGLSVVPHVFTTTLEAAVQAVRDKEITSRWEGARIEGLVGRPAVDLFTRKGERIITKLKIKDFDDLKRRGNG